MMCEEGRGYDGIELVVLRETEGGIQGSGQRMSWETEEELGN